MFDTYLEKFLLLSLFVEKTYISRMQNKTDA